MLSGLHYCLGGFDWHIVVLAGGLVVGLSATLVELDDFHIPLRRLLQLRIKFVEAFQALASAVDDVVGLRRFF